MDEVLRGQGAATRWRLQGALSALSADLKGRGGALVVRTGDAAEVVAGVAAEVDAAEIHATDWPEPARSAADAALGANGSCTWTKSSSARSSSSSIVRDTSSGSDTEPPLRNGSDWPTASTEAHPGSAQSASGSDFIALTVARPSRISSRESDGATTTTR